MSKHGATFALNKLVRNNLPQMMREMGQEPEVTQLQGDDLIHALIAKVGEELAELEPTDDSYEKELADLKQAVLDLIEASGATERVEVLRLEDLEKRGGFLAGHFIRGLHLQPDDPWVEYYRQDPGKYPEQKDEV